jgi:hypothetical protein
MALTKSVILTMAIAGSFAAVNDAKAGFVVHTLEANAPAHCQAFTPGPANTIRNRVVGSENVGPTMNVACTFEKVHSATASPVRVVDMFFHNNGATALSVNCTLLTGFQGQLGAVMLSKSVTVPQHNQAVIQFDAADTSNPADTDFGNNLIGVNCALPTGAVIGDTYLIWFDENGV